MPKYLYSFDHNFGGGNGIIEAKNKTEAKKAVVAALKADEPKDRKIEDLKVVIGDKYEEPTNETQEQ